MDDPTDADASIGLRPTNSMAVDAFDAMARVEREHWWFRAKRALVADQLERFGVDVKRPLIDVGCGTGGLLEHLSPDRPVVGIELDPHALSLARQAGITSALVQAGADLLPVRGGMAAAVTALDVVEHLDDDAGALRELARVAGDGLVVIAVPAYWWAWSKLDVRLGHRRRYTRSALIAAATSADLEVVRITHFHAWVTPIALVVRRTPVGRLLRGSAEESSFVSPTVNRIFGLLTAIERRLLHRFDLPFGLSILLVARARR